MSALKLLFGAACAYLAYVAQKYGNGENATFFLFAVVLLAGGVAYDVVKDLARRAVQPIPGGGQVQTEDQSFIANVVLCSGALALALRYSVVFIPIIVDECAKGGGQAPPSAMVLYALWGAVGLCLPFVAAFSGRNVAARLQRIFDPGTDRPIYQLGRPLLGCALFAP